MNIYSDAVIVMTQESYQQLWDLETEWSTELVRQANEVVKGKEQELLYFKSIKLSYVEPYTKEFGKFMEHFDAKDYFLYIVHKEDVGEYGIDTKEIGQLEPEWSLDYEVDISITFE